MSIEAIAWIGHYVLIPALIGWILGAAAHKRDDR